MLAGRIAAGDLMNQSIDLNEIPAPTTRLETKRPQVRVDPHLRTDQRDRRALREKARDKQLDIDLNSNRKTLVKRLAGKTSLSQMMTRPVKRRVVQSKRDSRTIQSSIEKSIASDTGEAPDV